MQTLPLKASCILLVRAPNIFLYLTSSFWILAYTSPTDYRVICSHMVSRGKILWEKKKKAKTLEFDKACRKPFPRGTRKVIFQILGITWTLFQPHIFFEHPWVVSSPTTSNLSVRTYLLRAWNPGSIELEEWLIGIVLERLKPSLGLQLEDGKSDIATLWVTAWEGCCHSCLGFEACVQQNLSCLMEVSTCFLKELIGRRSPTGGKWRIPPKSANGLAKK